MRHIRRHLTYANVMVTILVFIVLTGGTAVALSGSNTVFTDDVANDTQPASGGNPAGGLIAADLRPNSVGTSEAATDSLTGADISEVTLNLNPFFEAEFATGSCTADGGTETSCASTAITLPKPGQLLLNASGEWHTFGLDDHIGAGSGTDDTTLVRGACVLRVDGISAQTSQRMGEASENAALGGGTSVTNHPADAPGTLALTGLTGPLAAGAHTASVGCAELDGDIDWDTINLTAARVDN